ncbi:hypothetical protein BG015_010420 [Linnemannia schmuckeri]|uniref:Uncharacterized protein n=1 Tax=Linnemannia schmuckeri TaxID=64567 RepID=A0A9P5RUJ5_9FUNG|nr:hypothetical protein BG015_010420 [Linnemannia schmuckeri]
MSPYYQTLSVLLIIFLDFCKSVTFFAKQAQNLAPTAITTFPDGAIRQSRKDLAYLVAQYAYALWLLFMTLKAIVGFRANLKFNLRWMGKYNILFGLDTAFEFLHTTLGVIFQDLNSLDDAQIIRHYAISFLILLIQCYGFFCVWMHRKWVMTEMPHLMNSEGPPMTLLRLMFPCAYPRSSSSSSDSPQDSAAGTAPETAETSSRAGAGAAAGNAVDPRTLEEGTASLTTTTTAAAAATTTATTTTTTESQTPNLIQPSLYTLMLICPPPEAQPDRLKVRERSCEPVRRRPVIDSPCDT